MHTATAGGVTPGLMHGSCGRSQNPFNSSGNGTTLDPSGTRDKYLNRKNAGRTGTARRLTRGEVYKIVKAVGAGAILARCKTTGDN